MDYGPLLGGAPRGTSAARSRRMSGPRRIKAGAARDHFLGVTAVSGTGETFKSGGRVVKNVTGYDLCKLLAGSWGTLAAMTEVTIKVLPRPETEATVLVRGPRRRRRGAGDGGRDGLALRRSGAAHLPAHVAARIRRMATARAPLTALRLEGSRPRSRIAGGAAQRC